jgi:aminoglycoside phosphotransferase family enzyme
MSVWTINSILKTCSIEYKRLNESRLGDRLTDQIQVVEALRKPEAYDEEVGQIELKQTHISYVFLTRNFVYKVKKAVDFGFLDFSTLEKRRFFCEKELDLNRRLCGDMYIEVAPITISDVVKINGEGTPVEYAVKMKRIPEEKIMTRLLEEGKIDQKLVDRMAKIIAEFHKKAEGSKNIGEFGSLPMIERNWRENFEQTEEFFGETISPESYQLIQERIDKFMSNNRTLFARRVIENRIRECHGDIHSGNIFIAEKIYIFDAIEFNERFRYCDVASEVAFLAMDLDFKERSDLSNFLVDRYVKYSEDRELELLLPFYKCYRAYVRGKVISFKLNDPSVGSEEMSASTEEARAYFDLAANYAKQL